MRMANTMTDTDQPGPFNSGDRPPPMPCWVKAFGIVIVALVLLMVIVMATGHHGPGCHMHFGNSSGQTSPTTGAPRP